MIRRRVIISIMCFEIIFRCRYVARMASFLSIVLALTCLSCCFISAVRGSNQRWAESDLVIEDAAFDGDAVLGVNGSGFEGGRIACTRCTFAGRVTVAVAEQSNIRRLNVSLTQCDFSPSAVIVWQRPSGTFIHSLRVVQSTGAFVLAVSKTEHPYANHTVLEGNTFSGPVAVEERPPAGVASFELRGNNFSRKVTLRSAAERQSTADVLVASKHFWAGRLFDEQPAIVASIRKQSSVVSDGYGFGASAPCTCRKRPEGQVKR